MLISRRDTIARFSVVLTSATLLLSTYSSAVIGSVPNARLIVPGKSMGKISIGEDSALLSWLGTPRNSDAAMGHFWNFYGHKAEGNYTLGVYTVRNDTGSTANVKQVWTNSPAFHTSGGDRVGSSLRKILRDFPDAKPLSLAGLEHDAGTVLYDDPRLGISFQIVHTPGRKCSAILIHPAGQSALSEYLPVPSDTRWDQSIP